MMNEPKISIIVPAYNNEKYIEKCIKSITGQTLQALEIIVINDGSKDKTESIVMQLQKQDARIKLISQKNQGLMAARKRGIAEAKGKWIGFVDADDWIEPDMYRQLLLPAEQYDCDLVSSGIIHDYEDQRKSDELYDNYEEKIYRDIKKYIWPTMLFDEKKAEMGLKCTLVNKLYKKEIIEKVYKELKEQVSFGEDALTLYSYCLRIQSIYIKKESYYHYYIHAGSMCRNLDETTITNNYYLYTELKQLFCRQKEKYLLLRQLRQYMMSLEIYTLKNVYHIDVIADAKWDFSAYENVFDKKMILYGAGSCGQAFYKEILKHGKEKNLVAWVDNDYETARENCLYEVQPVEGISRVNFDCIVVAIKNKNSAQNVMQNLKDNRKIDPQKIIWLQADYTKLF